MNRHALPWTDYFRFLDTAERLAPGRHALNISPTHVPAHPFRRKP